MNSAALANFLYLRDPLGIEDEITISRDDLRTLAQEIEDEAVAEHEQNLADAYGEGYDEGYSDGREAED